MNKIGIHYGYWTRNWNADYGEYVQRASKLGFDIIEFDLSGFFHKSEKELDDIVALAKFLNIEITFCVGFGKEYDMASDILSIRQNGIQYAIKNLKLIKKLGGKVFSGITYGAWQPELPETVDDKSIWLENSVNSVKEVSKVADELGIQYNIEIVNRFEQFLINTVSEGIDFIERVGNPNIKLLLDTFHMNIEEDSFHEAIIMAGDKLGHFHLGEANRKPPGKGRLPWDEIFNALKEINYDGRIVMEPFVKMGGEVGKSIFVWRDLFEGSPNEMDKEAIDALHFVRNKIG